MRYMIEEHLQLFHAHGHPKTRSNKNGILSEWTHFTLTEIQVHTNSDHNSVC
jgi:hypothetical protein